MAMLSASAAAIDGLARYGIGAAGPVQIAAAPPTADSATAAMGVFQSQYTPSAWFAAVQTVEDKLREYAAMPWWPISSGRARLYR